MLLVWDDDGEGLCGVLASVYADVANEIARFVDGLEALQGDVLYSVPVKHTLRREKRTQNVSIPLHFAT